MLDCDRFSQCVYWFAGYVVKSDDEEYEGFVASTFQHNEEKLATSLHQVAVQFLYREKDPVLATEEIKTNERFLVLVHKESKLL